MATVPIRNNIQEFHSNLMLAGQASSALADLVRRSVVWAILICVILHSDTIIRALSKAYSTDISSQRKPGRLRLERCPRVCAVSLPSVVLHLKREAVASEHSPPPLDLLAHSTLAADARSTYVTGAQAAAWVAPLFLLPRAPTNPDGIHVEVLPCLTDAPGSRGVLECTNHFLPRQRAGSLSSNQHEAHWVKQSLPSY